MKQLACPISLHPDGTPRRIPAIEHPTTGMSLVAGDIPAGMRPDAAAARILIQQSGLETRSALLLGASTAIQADTEWHFSLCRLKPPVRDRWAHLSVEATRVTLCWIDLDAPAPTAMDEASRNAFAWIQANL